MAILIFPELLHPYLEFAFLPTVMSPVVSEHGCPPPLISPGPPECT